jgi:tripartite-type tricarboxylate transporter receptor subunit TctC
MPDTPHAPRRALLRGLVAAAPALAMPAVARAQGEWPNRPLRFIVPFAPGGSSDLTARLTAQPLSARLGRPVVVENRAGAATTIGAAEAARATDGHTILLAPPPFVITQFAYPNLTYDPVRDFQAVALLVSSPIALYVRAGFPTRMADIVAQARANPGTVTYGTPGNGSLPHVASELLKLRTGLEATHVPYRGGGPAAIDLAAGRIDFMVTSPVDVASGVQSGRIVPAALAAARRSPAFPDLPTLAEMGVRDYEVSAWFGVVAPAAMPAAHASRLNAEFNAVLALPEVRTRLADLGVEAAGGTSQAFAAHLDAERARWSEAVRAAQVRVE